MARTAQRQDMVRRNIELHPRTAARLDRLRDHLEATSDTEVFRRALQVLESLVDDERAGKLLCINDPATGQTVGFRIAYAEPQVANDAAPQVAAGPKHG